MEGDIGEGISVVHEPGVDANVMKRVHFFKGDACALSDYAESKDGFGQFDGVIMANLLCRLPYPRATLEALPKVVNTGGVVVLVTPFSWLEGTLTRYHAQAAVVRISPKNFILVAFFQTDFTPRSNWLGGFIDPVIGQPIHSKVVLAEIMQNLGFVKIHEQQMPLIIREHRRKYQYILSEATGWRKK